MVPDISEFSYGFALTRELIALTGDLKAAPVFPSLIAEGKKGGGYDVNLDIPGFPLFIQFKRSECMVRRTARETRSPMNFATPFYRMKIAERSRSAQHEMLLDLDGGPNEVFYAAPLFHTVEELNKAYLANSVSAQSCYVRPSKIGKLDGEAHHVAFDKKRFWVCSDPRQTEGLHGAELGTALERRLGSESRSFRDGPLGERLSFVEEILGRRNISSASSREPIAASGLEPIAALTDSQLQRLGELSFQYFGAQLFIVQRREH